MEKIDLTKLKGIIPDAVIAQIPIIEEKFQINTVLRLCHFLAQCQLESGNFSVVVENLNYSAKRLLEVFPAYFKTRDVNLYGGHPDKIGNLIYSNRMGNGPEESFQGSKYKGRGFIQLTGLNNYKAFTQAIGEDCVANPDLVASKYPLASAAWFFSKNGLNAIADLGASDDVVTKITKRVNGGVNGLSERLTYFHSLYKLLHEDPKA